MDGTQPTPGSARHDVDAPWRRTAAAAGLLGDAGPVPTVFETMTGLAVEHGAVNLGQGFPDADGPDTLLRLAADAVLAGPNQYAPGTGDPALRQAVAEHRRRHWGVTEDPATQVMITTGATEGIAATVLAFVRPGDEVLTVEPFYDSHAATIALAGARHVSVPVEAPDFLPDPARVADAITDRTRLLIVNTPHNPTGAVYPRELLEELVALCRSRGVLMLSDEVYDHLVYEGEHVSLRSVAGAEDIALTVSSAGKAFAVTGWKVGWLNGPAELVGLRAPSSSSSPTPPAPPSSARWVPTCPPTTPSGTSPASASGTATPGIGSWRACGRRAWTRSSRRRATSSSWTWPRGV